MHVVPTSHGWSTLKRALGLIALLALCFTDAKAYFTVVSSDPYIVTTVNKTHDQIQVQTSPIDNIIDTIHFQLSGDTSIKLDFESPMITALNTFNIYFNYQGANGDTSIAWLVIWDKDRRDTVTIYGINPGPSGPPDASITYPDFTGMEPGDTLCHEITFRNFYDYPVLLTDLVIDNPRFSISGIDLPRSVGPDTTVKFELCYIAADSTYASYDSLVAHYYTQGERYTESQGLDVIVGSCFTMSTDSIYFGTITVGQDSLVQFSITNPMSSTINVTYTSTYDNNSNDYLIAGGSNSIQVPGNSTVNVNMAVVVYQAGLHMNRWKFTSGSCEKTFTALVRGEANYCFTTNLDTLALGPIMMGEDTTVEAMFVNHSSDTIEINYDDYGGDTTNTYVWSQSFPLTIAPNDTVYLTLTVTAEDIGNYARGLRFYNAADSLSCMWHFAVVELNVISNNTLPQVDLYQSKGHSFETTLADVAVPIWLRNNSSGAVTVRSFELLDSTNFTFRKNPSTPLVINANGGTRLDLGFTSLVAGDYTDTLRVTLTNGAQLGIPINGKQNSTADIDMPVEPSYELSAWPNPSVGQFMIDIRSVDRGTVAISDMLGRTIYSAVVAMPMSIDARQLGMMPGSYIIRVSGVDERGSKFVRSTMISVQ